MEFIWNKEIRIVKELRDPNCKMKTKRSDFPRIPWNSNEDFGPKEKIRKIVEDFQIGLEEARRRSRFDLIFEEENRNKERFQTLFGSEAVFPLPGNENSESMKKIGPGFDNYQS